MPVRILDVAFETIDNNIAHHSTFT
jgi:hypothetical protein